MDIEIHRERFLKSFTKGNPNECWEWNKNIFNNGYGRFCFNRKSTTAHRFAMMLKMGTAIDKDLEVCHVCDNRLCVNTEHLFLGTAKDNALDKVAKGRQSRLPGELTGTHKLKTAEVLFILNSKLPHRQLARQFGVCDRTIRLIRLGETWRHLNNE